MTAGSASGAVLKLDLVACGLDAAVSPASGVLCFAGGESIDQSVSPGEMIRVAGGSVDSGENLLRG